ncbi:uncharacterized protein [Drosophila takahashii]
MSATNSNSFAGSTMRLYPTRRIQKYTRTSEANKKNTTFPKTKPEVEKDEKALVKTKPKRKKMLIKKLPTRSTAGNIEQSPDDDGIWFECNVPFRVNIPFPISMKNLFGSQTFSGNSNLQIFKALAPTGIIQKDTKMKYPFNVSMCPALPPEDLESNMYTPKATKCAKKKGLRRGRKHCPCETSTQTIEDESDPVLSCLEQIRKQLAAKSPEIQEKNIFRCFAEKSTNVRSIQKQTNEPDVEKVKDSASKETFQDKTPSSTMSQKSLETTSLNMLPLPNPEDTKIENLNNVPKTPSNANSKRSSICIESKKESQGKNETIPNSNREDIELPNLKDADKEKDLLNATKPVLKSAICFCRLPQCPPKCTRIMIPGSMCQGHFMGKYHMPRWQYSRPTQQQYIQRQEFTKQAASKMDAVDIRIKSGNSIQGNESYISSRMQSNCDSISESSTSSRSKSLFEASNSTTSRSQSSFEASNSTISKNRRINPTDRKYCPEGSIRSSKCQGSKDLFQKRRRYISSNESMLSSKISSYRSYEIKGTKWEKMAKESDAINSKTHRNQTRNKPNQRHNSRISSGGESVPEDPTSQGYKNGQIYEIEEQRDNTEINKSESNISKDFADQRNYHQERLRNNKKPRIDEYFPYRQNKNDGTSFQTNRGNTDIKKVSSNITKNSDQVKTFKSCSSNREYSCYYEKCEHSEEITAKTSESGFTDQLNRNGIVKELPPYSEKVIQPKKLNLSRYEHREWFYKQRSQSAPECWILQGYQRNHTNRSEKSYLCQSPQCRTYHENVLVLQDETCESESDDYELVRDDKDTSNSRWCECQTPDYSINADILKQLREQERPCNPHQVQGITSIPRGNQCPDDCEILQQEQGRENPPLVLVPFRMNRRKILSISRPKKWRDLGMKFTKLRRNQFHMAPQNVVPNKEFKRPSEINSNSSSSQSSSSRTDTIGNRNNNFQNIKKLSYPGPRKCHHKTCHIGSLVSATHYSPSEYPSYTRLTGLQNDSNASCNSKSIRSTFNSRQREDKNTNEQLRNNESQILYIRNGYKCARTDQGNLQSLKRLHNSDISASFHHPATQTNPNGLTWTELGVPLNASSVNKSVTLMQPRKLRSSDSAGIRNIENTVLIETRTPCNRENLLQTCGRPPCNFCPRQYTGLPPSLQAGFMISKPPDHTIQPQTSMSAPQNLAPFDENYLIDPRDQWRTIKSPASAPVMKDEFQHQGLMNSYQPTNSLCPHFQEHPSLGCHQFNNPGYYTQKLKDNINMLPEGFYDHTVNKYNITRMDSNFQPPPLLPEFLLAQQQHFIRHPAFPHGNQFQQHLVMGSVQQLHRPFIPTQNQYPAELQTHPTMFCPQQSVKLDDYDQSEYQI